MTTPPTPPTDNLAAEGGPRSEMSEPCCRRTEHHCDIGLGITGSPCCPQCEHGRTTAEREGLSELLAAEIWKHTGERCSLECGDGFGYHDVESESDRRGGVAHLADALADLLAARDRRVRGEALREAAEEAEALRSFAHGKNPTSEAHLIGYGTARRGIVRLLRERADRIEADE